MTDTDTDTEPPDREEILRLLEDGIREAHRKVTSGRVRDAENEKVRQGWIRALAYTANQYRQLKRDEELDALDERVAELETQLTGGTGDADPPETDVLADGGRG